MDVRESVSVMKLRQREISAAPLLVTLDNNYLSPNNLDKLGLREHKVFLASDLSVDEINQKFQEYFL